MLTLWVSSTLSITRPDPSRRVATDTVYFPFDLVASPYRRAALWHVRTVTRTMWLTFAQSWPSRRWVQSRRHPDLHGDLDQINRETGPGAQRSVTKSRLASQNNAGYADQRRDRHHGALGLVTRILLSVCVGLFATVMMDSRHE